MKLNGSLQVTQTVSDGTWVSTRLLAQSDFVGAERGVGRLSRPGREGHLSGAVGFLQQHEAGRWVTDGRRGQARASPGASSPFRLAGRSS